MHIVLVCYTEFATTYNTFFTASHIICKNILIQLQRGINIV